MFIKATLYFLAQFLFVFNLRADNGVAVTELPVQEDYVFVLDTQNFDQFVNNNEITCVFFYAPWCGHCKGETFIKKIKQKQIFQIFTVFCFVLFQEMKPFFHEAAKLLREDESFKTDKPVVLAKVDATVEKNLTARFDLKGFPTLHSKKCAK